MSTLPLTSPLYIHTVHVTIVCLHGARIDMLGSESSLIYTYIYMYTVGSGSRHFTRVHRRVDTKLEDQNRRWNKLPNAYNGVSTNYVCVR